MKKIFINLVFVIFSFVAMGADIVDIYDPNSKTFRDGFEAGIKAVAFQAKTDGFQEKLILITKPFLLVYDIANVPLHEALFLQVITSREGFDTHFTRHFVALGEFEREIDAKDAKDLIAKKYKINPSVLKILKNQNSIVTYPFLFDGFYKTLLNEAQNLGYVIKTETIYTNQTQITKPKNAKLKVTSKKIIFRNKKAMGYMLNGDQEQSVNYTEKGLMQSKNYEFEKSIKTNEGESFAKVKGQNLYFSNSDVDIK